MPIRVKPSRPKPNIQTAGTEWLLSRWFSAALGASESVASVELPQGWTASPAQQPLKFARGDEELTLRFVVKPPLGTKAGEYRVRAFAEKRENIWIGWLEFRPKSGKALKTDEETSQPSKDAVRYWATGLERVYLEGALERAK